MSLSSTKSFREVEYSSVAQCPFETKDNSNDDGDVDVDVDAVSRCISSISGACIRLAPMERNNKRPNKPPRWVDTVHFHDLLQLPEQQQPQQSPPPSANDTEESKGKSAEEEETKNAEEATKRSFVLQWQGMAREGMAVALSPNKGFVLGETFEIVFGANGNTSTILQRKVKNDNTTGNANTVKSMAMQTPGRVCQERAWTSYWICCHQGTLYAGVGDSVGQQCIGLLSNNHGGGCSLPSSIRFIGLGNAGIGDRDKPAMPLKVRNIRLLSSTSGQLPDSFSFALMEISAQANKGSGGGGMAIVHLGQEEIPLEQKTLLEEYEKECVKARLRAEKFGLPYKEPPLTNSMAWSHVRRLKANPKQGFITGMDLADPAERAKQDARKNRFGGGSSTEAEGKAGEAETKDDNDQQPTDDSKPRASAAGIDKVLPVTQAWENEEFVRSHRADPPTCLWKIPPTDEDNLNNVDKKKTKKNAFAMEPKDPPTYTLEKVHVFSLDWAAFKQIRNNDLMAYFGVYSPTYIEWLGDFSANIHFQDQYSAARALQNLSQELPSPPPPPPPLLGDDVDSSKSGDLKNNDEDKDSEKERNDKEQSELKSIKDGEEEEKQQEQVDLGRMGWRLGNTLVRKISNDRHGRRGTTARILLRMATSLDVLQERPSTWAKIPGFSTQHVLGPTIMSNSGHLGNSDDNGAASSAGRIKKNKSKKRERATAAINAAPAEKKNGAGKKRQQSGKNKNDGGTQSLIDRGLRASRSGFSVEEMEAERARKKAKTAFLEV